MSRSVLGRESLSRRIRCNRMLVLALVSALLAGCAPTSSQLMGSLVIDESLSSKAKKSRVEVIVLHYTASNTPIAKLTLTQEEVSAHYLVTDDSPPVIYRLVPETYSAWHAGESSWYGKSALNSNSIGIEIVHPGWAKNSTGELGPTYPNDQIDTVIKLVKDIAKRYQITPENIVGHSDVAPSRKLDPGPAFPWKQLAEAGLGRWFNETQANQNLQKFNTRGIPDARWFQTELKRVGYGVTETGVLDGQTKAAINAFQLHYRPSQVSGLPDAETAARLLALPTAGTGLNF